MPGMSTGGSLRAAPLFFLTWQAHALGAEAAGARAGDGAEQLQPRPEELKGLGERGPQRRSMAAVLSQGAPQPRLEGIKVLHSWVCVRG